MKKFLLITAAALYGFASFAQQKELTPEQKATQEKLEKSTEGWSRSGAIGADFIQLLLINPSVSAGQNKLGLTGIGGLGATYKKGRLIWDNGINETFGIQRLGRGSNIQAQKSIDELRAFTSAGYQVKDGSKWYYMFDGRLKTQLTPTYTGSYLNLKKFEGESDSLFSLRKKADLLSKFFAPANITLSPGVSYIPNANWDFFLSPISANIILVLNDDIAKKPGGDFAQTTTKGLYGTDWKLNDNGEVTYSKTMFQLGATARARYKNKFLKDKISYTSQLTLFTNYLNQPFILTDVEWLNDFGFTLYKGLQLGLTLNVMYDHDVFTKLDRDGKIETGVDGYESTGRRVQLVEAFFIKYGFTF